jgi:hypothetical protein
VGTSLGVLGDVGYWGTKVTSYISEEMQQLPLLMAGTCVLRVLGYLSTLGNIRAAGYWSTQVTSYI